MSLLPVDEYRKTRGIHRIGTRALQPAYNTVLEGTLYFVTDEFVIERAGSAAWESYGGPKGEVSITTTGNIDDLDFTNNSTIRMNNATLATIRGLKAGKAGQKVTIISVGAGIVEFAHQNAGSVAANRLINFATSAPTRLAAGVGTATYQYDDVTDRWRLIEHNQGAFITQTYNAGNFTGGGGMAWGVDAGDQTTYAYYLIGRKLSVILWLITTSVTAPLGQNLIAAIPGGYVCTQNTMGTSGDNTDAGVYSNPILLTCAASGTVINIFKPSLALWTASVNATQVRASLDISVN